MWAARGMYRNREGRVMPLSEGSALWTDKAALIEEVLRRHQGIAPVPDRPDWYRWVDEAGVERFVVIEEC